MADVPTDSTNQKLRAIPKKRTKKYDLTKFFFKGWNNLDDKEECRYRAFRDTEGHLTPAHYKILGLKLAFVIIFEVCMIGRGPKFVL